MVHMVLLMNKLCLYQSFPQKFLFETNKLLLESFKDLIPIFIRTFKDPSSVDHQVPFKKSCLSSLVN